MNIWYLIKGCLPLWNLPVLLGGKPQTIMASKVHSLDMNNLNDCGSACYNSYTSVTLSGQGIIRVFLIMKLPKCCQCGPVYYLLYTSYLTYVPLSCIYSRWMLTEFSTSLTTADLHLHKVCTDHPTHRFTSTESYIFISHATGAAMISNMKDSVKG